MKGYEFANQHKMKLNHITTLNKLSSIDDNILIIDDILDQSQTRNGKPCLYKQIGLQRAIVEAELLRNEFILNIIFLMNELKTSEKNQMLVIKLVHSFLKSIYVGQDIDIKLTNEKNISKGSIQKYFKMISLFTGGHIKFGIEIGQIIANKNIDSNVSNVAISIGIIRQIYDDFCDYFPLHHEPFGDFINHSNRLPEILFKLQGGNINIVDELIKKNQLNKARSVVLDKKVRERLYHYCDLEIKKINKTKTNFDCQEMLSDYKTILTM